MSYFLVIHNGGMSDQQAYFITAASKVAPVNTYKNIVEKEFLNHSNGTENIAAFMTTPATSCLAI